MLKERTTKQSEGPAVPNGALSGLQRAFLDRKTKVSRADRGPDLLRALTGYQESISGRRRALLDQLTTLETDSGSSEAEKGPFSQSEGPAIQRGPSQADRGLF